MIHSTKFISYSKKQILPINTHKSLPSHQINHIYQFYVHLHSFSNGVIKLTILHYFVLTQGDGQPLLHKAVLRGSVGVTQLLAETLVYQRKQRLDSIRDQVATSVACVSVCSSLVWLSFIVKVHFHCTRISP